MVAKKSSLRRLPWAKTGLITGALALILASVWFGERGQFAGRITSQLVSTGNENQVAYLLTDPTPTVNPFVTDVDATPTNRIRRSSGDTISISYRLTKNVNKFYVTIQQTNGNTQIVKTLDLVNSRNAGTYSGLSWDGTGTYVVNGVTSTGVVPSGSYYLTFAADGQTIVRRLLYVDDYNGGNNNTTVFRDVSISPNSGTFNPTVGEQGQIFYTLNRAARVTAVVRSSNTNLQVAYLKDQYVNTIGQQLSIDWNGRTNPLTASGTIVPNGLYYVTLTARDDTGAEQQYQAQFSVTNTGVNNNNANFQISQFALDPASLDTRISPTIRFSVSITQIPQSLLMTVYDSAGTRLISNLTPNGTCLGSGANRCTYLATWDGYDRFANSFVYPGTYQFKFEATHSQYGTVRAERSFQVVQTSGGNYNYDNNGGYYDPYNPYYDPYGQYGYNPGAARCANFADVDASDALCNAVKFVTDRGIMRGYQNGGITSMGLNNTIRRGEFLAVIQSAFKYNLESYNAQYDGNLGYSDLTGRQNEWYMPYIKTFSRNGIMTGYPNHTMQPEKVMTTAELYVSLFRAAFEAPSRPARFTLPNILGYRPYTDTPITDATMWFIRHAVFAKENNLVTGTKFNPAKGITRGQVIKLIFDLYNKNLVSL